LALVTAQDGTSRPSDLQAAFHWHVVTSVLIARLERGELELLSLSGHRFPARRWRANLMSNRSRLEKARGRPTEQYMTSAALEEW
jgi:hypothetical protein